MKKILTLAAIAFAAMTITSCDSATNEKTEENATPDLVYNIKGTAEGEVEFTWFNGGAKVNGNAEVKQCNDNKDVFTAESTKNALTLEQAVRSNDVKVSKAACEVRDMLTVKGVDGKYKLTLTGYVKYGAIYLVIDEVYPKDSVK